MPRSMGKGLADRAVAGLCVYWCSIERASVREFMLKTRCRCFYSGVACNSVVLTPFVACNTVVLQQHMIMIFSELHVHVNIYTYMIMHINSGHTVLSS